MKYKIKLLFTFLLFSVFSYAQKNTIVGEWYNADKDAIITIFVEGETISGKTTWMKEPLDKDGNPKLDKLNPDEKLKARKRLGLKIMHGFIYKGNNVWEDGRIYNPKKGKTYGGTATLVDHNTLELEGYLISLPFIGKTATWKRKK